MGKGTVLSVGENEDVCTYKGQYPGVWLYFEQNSVSKGVIQYIITLDIAIGKINERKEVQTNISVYLFQTNEIIVKITTV
jgi:hypothetical protein